jgi:hypothetical protein
MTVNSLLQTWIALEGAQEGVGWKLMPLQKRGGTEVRAGRKFPDNREALVCGFNQGVVPPAKALPKGRGFEVEVVDSELISKSTPLWISLCRKETGSLELFTLMAADIISVLDATLPEQSDYAFKTFMSRISAWQDFMQRETESSLGKEAELGLVGELTVLSALLGHGLPAPYALDCWQGPSDGLQDFLLGSGAIEVKTTSSGIGASVQIGSLEQLDDALLKPIFLGLVRLIQDEPGGATLPQIVVALREQMSGDTSAYSSLESKLLQAGYIDAHAARYTRRYQIVAVRFYPMVREFPRLTRSAIDPGVINARYSIVLDDSLPTLELPEVIRQLGVS